MTAAPDNADDFLSPENREMRALVSAVSHDLRAPLRSVDGFALAIEEDYADRLDAAGLDYLRRIRSAARRMDRMLVGLVLFAKLADHRPEPEHTDISHIAADVLAGLRERDPEHVPEILVSPGIVADTDRELVRTMLQELLANAWKFTRGRNDARIAVTAEPAPEGRVAFAVRDNGAGFDAAAAGGKIFGLFQRFHVENDFAGEGVGLAAARRAARVLGGDLHAESSPGNGAAFLCVLPA